MNKLKDAFLKKTTTFLARFLQEVHIPRLITPAEKGRDLESRVMDAYIIQCQAEAQEGIVATFSGLNTALATINLYKLVLIFNHTFL